MITILNLKKSFGETVACDIPSFTVNKGDLLGLVGNNGAGKTTLIKKLIADSEKDRAEPVAVDSDGLPF